MFCNVIKWITWLVYNYWLETDFVRMSARFRKTSPINFFCQGDTHTGKFQGHGRFLTWETKESFKMPNMWQLVSKVWLTFKMRYFPMRRRYKGLSVSILKCSWGNFARGTKVSYQYLNWFWNYKKSFFVFQKLQILEI